MSLLLTLLGFLQAVLDGAEFHYLQVLDIMQRDTLAIKGAAYMPEDSFVQVLRNLDPDVPADAWRLRYRMNVSDAGDDFLHEAMADVRDLSCSVLVFPSVFMCVTSNSATCFLLPIIVVAAQVIWWEKYRIVNERSLQSLLLKQTA